VDRPTLPSFSGSPTAPFISFVNRPIPEQRQQGGGATLDRTKEGY
jgi:hypothetical protein